MYCGTYLGKLAASERREGRHRHEARIPGPEGSIMHWKRKSGWLDPLGWLEGSRTGKGRSSWVLSAGIVCSWFSCHGVDEQKGQRIGQKERRLSSFSAAGWAGGWESEGPRGRKGEGPGEFERSLALNRRGNSWRLPRGWRTFERMGQCSGSRRLPGRWTFG